ncbi:hypothetical protein AS030_04220 [Fictibacillus enclensis]|uniref:Uncharacterized protein n=1 Tax=Fictibacillus enclensis TaxID=1017270 RepID=A0A0V8JCT8_9BACL|nr:hypothetical protein AS030_04220 [Fictibacillus enclensis]
MHLFLVRLLAERTCTSNDDKKYEQYHDQGETTATCNESHSIYLLFYKLQHFPYSIWSLVIYVWTNADKHQKRALKTDQEFHGFVFKK